MTNEELIREITSLPADAKRQIERIVERFKSTQRSDSRLKKQIPLREEPFFGMWADREDMADPVEYIRKLRREQWGPRQKAD